MDLQLQHLLDYPTLIYLTLKFVFLFFGLVLDPFISLSCFQSVDFKFINLKTFLVAQQLGLLASTTGGMDLIPLVRELRSCMLHGMAKKKGWGEFINSQGLQKHWDEGPSSPITCVIVLNPHASASMPHAVVLRFHSQWSLPLTGGGWG